MLFFIVFNTRLNTRFNTCFFYFLFNYAFKYALKYVFLLIFGLITRFRTCSRSTTRNIASYERSTKHLNTCLLETMLILCNIEEIHVQIYILDTGNRTNNENIHNLRK